MLLSIFSYIRSMDTEAIKRRYPNGFVYALISGHGGMVNGEYTTAPKKMATLPSGRIVYEGVENRKITAEILRQTKYTSIQCIDVVPEAQDTPLLARVHRVNDLFDTYKEKGQMVILIENHLNAFNGKVEGTEIYTTRKENLSDHIAKVWWDKLITEFPNQRRRPDYSDGDPDKEADFFVIKNIRTFGVLIEYFFFDNENEVEKYCNSLGYARWAGVTVEMMKELNKLIYK